MKVIECGVAVNRDFSKEPTYDSAQYQQHFWKKLKLKIKLSIFQEDY